MIFSGFASMHPSIMWVLSSKHSTSTGIDNAMFSSPWRWPPNINRKCQSSLHSQDSQPKRVTRWQFVRKRTSDPTPALIPTPQRSKPAVGRPHLSTLRVSPHRPHWGRSRQAHCKQFCSSTYSTPYSTPPKFISSPRVSPRSGVGGRLICKVIGLRKPKS